MKQYDACYYSEEIEVKTLQENLSKYVENGKCIDYSGANTALVDVAHCDCDCDIIATCDSLIDANVSINLSANVDFSFSRGIEYARIGCAIIEEYEADDDGCMVGIDCEIVDCGEFSHDDIDKIVEHLFG